MRKSMLSKVMITALSIITVLAGVVLPGCTRKNVTIPQELDKLSLAETWEKLIDATGVQNDAVELDTFRLHTEENGRVDSLSLEFRGVNNKRNSEIYFASMNSK